jgi:hypothetical protein
VVVRTLSILNFARPAVHLHRLLQRDLVDLCGAVGQPLTILGFMIDFGIWALADVHIVCLLEVNRRKAGEQQAADEDCKKDSPFHIELVNGQ